MLVNLSSYEAPYLGREGGRPGRPTQAVRHACSRKLGIVKIYKIVPHKHKSIVKKKDGAAWPMGPCAQAHLSTMVNPALAG